jgi:hypothetical protein
MLVSPSPASQAMGGTGVALPTDDAFGFYYNPAILGISAEETNISTQFYPVRRIISLFNPVNITDASSHNNAISAGVNLDSLTGIPISVGTGFIRQDIQWFNLLDEQLYTESVKNRSSASTFCLSASVDLWVKLGLGISIRSIYSEDEKLEYTYPPYYNNTITTFDVGFMAVAPVLRDFTLFDKLNADFNISIGYSLSNLGTNFSNNDYILGSYNKYERIGYALDASIKYDFKGTKIKIINAELTGEGGMFRLSSEFPGIIDKPVFKGINIWDNVIEAKSQYRVNGRLGWNVNLFETLSLSGGHYKDITGIVDYEYSSFGFSIQTAGLLKLIKSISGNSIAGFMADHLNMRYKYAEITSKPIFWPFASVPVPYMNIEPGYYNGIELIIKGFSF